MTSLSITSIIFLGLMERMSIKSSEAKLDILVSAMEEMMQRINRKDEIVVQRHHVPLISEKEKVIVSKHFVVHPWYHGLDNDSFMYSIHNTVKDEAPSKLVEEQPTDMMCMFDDIPTWIVHPSAISMMMHMRMK
jgi:hypothetical protein